MRPGRVNVRHVLFRYRWSSAPTFVEYSVPDSWSAEEVAATVASYLDMLELELRNERFTKASYNRELRRFLNNRSEGAVEFKFANVSAVMIELGFPYIDGYKPRGNYQESLRAEIRQQWGARPVLALLSAHAAVAEVAAPAGLPRPDDVFVPVPVDQRNRGEVRERDVRRPLPRMGVNYPEMEARNAALGHAGELFVMQLEHQRLWTVGARRLAERIEHVADTQGDGLGYDIVSYETDGRERLIEVKTTSFGAMTPFYATRREVAVSQEQAEAYRLYRLHKFRSTPKVFVLTGALDQTCLLDPILYSARPA